MRSLREGRKWSDSYNFPNFLPGDTFQIIAQSQHPKQNMGFSLLWENKKWNFEVEVAENFRKKWWQAVSPSMLLNAKLTMGWIKCRKARRRAPSVSRADQVLEPARSWGNSNSKEPKRSYTVKHAGHSAKTPERPVLAVRINYTYNRIYSRSDLMKL